MSFSFNFITFLTYFLVIFPYFHLFLSFHCFLLFFFWKGSCDTLLKAIDNWTEEELDTYLIPHPLIGKMTLRELLFFTVYHIGHHLKTIKNINKTV